MLNLHEPQAAARWLKSHVTGQLQTDSRLVGPGDGFIAWPGAVADGRQFVAAAIHQGAGACLMELAGVEQFTSQLEALPNLATCTGLKAACGPIAAAYYDDPSRKLDVVAVTGTNGKTSSSWWLAQALVWLYASEKTACGLVGTLGAGAMRSREDFQTGSGALQATGLTTPDPVFLQHSLHRFVSEGVKTCVIEASSIGLAEHRLDGTQIRTAIFTNFSQDHLDYHGSMASYWQAKTRLFDWSGLQAAVINADDSHGAELALRLQGQALDVWTFSCQGDARLQAQDIALEPKGLRFTVVEGDERLVVTTSLIGGYNVANLLGVMAALRSLGVSLQSAAAACSNLDPVPGRMDCLNLDGLPLAVVDYAHTPDALAQALQALRPLADLRRGRLWCVFGCGGSRDPLKRPLMGAEAVRHADVVVVTSDNPRSEAPEHIISQILLGLEKSPDLMVLADRAQAIARTVAQAAAADVILVAGKGHEDYQDLGEQRVPFSDPAHLSAALRSRSDGAARTGNLV